ncbi:MAG: hypothetical protein RJA91_967 [Pseudomonadota bacterium]
MNYISSTDKEYKGIDITIYETTNSGYTVDIKKPCGELIWGYEFEATFDEALMSAVSFIDMMEVRGYEI